MQKIIITKNEGVTTGDDAFHARVEGSEMWGWGTTADAAVGNLVRTYPKVFDLEVAETPSLGLCYLIHDWRRNRYLWCSEIKPETNAAVKLCGYKQDHKVNKNGLWFRWMDRATMATTYDSKVAASIDFDRMELPLADFDIMPRKTPVTDDNPS